MAAYTTEPAPVQYIMADGSQMYAPADAAPTYTMDPGAYVTSMPGAPQMTPQMMYSQSPYSIPVGASSVQAVQPSMYTTSPYGYGGFPMMDGLDHSQGKWFAPGEALPPGFVVTAHPEGHAAPQETHAMTDLARESFVVTGSSAPEPKLAKASKPKKSKKKKGSTCCWALARCFQGGSNAAMTFTDYSESMTILSLSVPWGCKSTHCHCPSHWKT